ncbi:MAG: hypothetical protein GEV07_06130 [Streptosporangiales bacterium]|nr:hypothetical protein [Streptosporangiales bacterium]
MSALDDLVAALQASLSSVQRVHEHGGQGGHGGGDCGRRGHRVWPGSGGCRDRGARAGIEEAGGVLATVEAQLTELLERAIALRGGTAVSSPSGSVGTGTQRPSPAQAGQPDRPTFRFPGATSASVDPGKFANYSMHPEKDNGGEWQAWVDLGYDAHSADGGPRRPMTSCGSSAPGCRARGRTSIGRRSSASRA